jgi:hypothetical protein
MGCVVAILFALFLVIGRCFIEPRLDLPTWEGTYETIAHLFVGGLIGVWFIRRGTRAEAFDSYGFDCGWLAVFLSAYELVFFLVQKFGG